MAIRKHEEWGVEVERPHGLEIVAGDAALARSLAHSPERPAAVETGDLARTVGARPIGDRRVLRALPLDLLEVTLDHGDPMPAVAHVVVRTPGVRGGWWRGPVTVVMNAEFIGEWDVAPRGHPNDGRAERFDLDGSVGVRQRSAIARRMRSASHLPHPGITRRVGSEHVIDRPRPALVVIDGAVAGRARRIAVTVRPDAATWYA